MNSYLSRYYDSLFQDLDGTKRYLDFCLTHHLQSPLLELAAGSGDLALSLQKQGYEVLASDVDLAMLEKSKMKGVKQTVQLDMTQFKVDPMASIICFGDSFNYLLTLEAIEALFESVKGSLDLNGLFCFDMHTFHRLDEFEEEYLEEVDLGEVQVQWSALKEGDYLDHQFVFFTDQSDVIEKITQRVYSESVIEQLLEKTGFAFEKRIDFDQFSQTKQSEKIFYICRHKEAV